MESGLNPSPEPANQILLLFDWENFFYGLFNHYGSAEMYIERRIEGLMRWTKGIGELLGDRGIVFAPEHLSSIHQEICVKNGLWLMTCPKKHLNHAERNLKSGKLEIRVDTVDETIIRYAKAMVGHPKFKTICLVSGDNDYVPLFQEMGQLGIKRALAAPTLESLSKTKELINLADINPRTNEKMVLILDKF